MNVTLPARAQVVIVGGGIAGASTAYHLTKLGVRDVVLLEQGRLTCGTTWHAAGLVGQTRATRNATRMSRYGIELYSSLENETGLATGWKQCGSLNVAKTAGTTHVDEAADGARKKLRDRFRVHIAGGSRQDRTDPAHRRP
jgi:4-methylaminobutanoate oxidase (formaldehyde-forming)